MKITTFPEEEKSILGTALISKDSADRLIQTMRPEFFSDPVNQKIFQLQTNIYNRGYQITSNSLKMEASECGFYEKHVNEIVLLTTYADYSNLELYIDKIKVSYQKRRIAEYIRRMSNDLDNSGLDKIAEICNEYSNDTNEKTTYSIKECFENFEDGLSYLDVLQKRQERFKSGQLFSGYSTGFPSIDKAIMGLNKGHYIVIGGTPGSGKTSLAVQIMRNLEDQKIKVGVLTLELSNNQLSEKIISSQTGISYNKLQSGDISGIDYQKCVNAVNPRSKDPDSMVFLEDIPINNISALTSRVRRLIEIQGVQVLVIDYIGLIGTGDKGATATDRLTKISICIKDLLKKYKIPGIVLVQLVKSVENTPPNKYHIKDASQIIQDAYEILMLWDPDPDSQSDGPTKRTLFIRKARFGPASQIDLHFDGSMFTEASVYNRETEQMIKESNKRFSQFEPDE